MDEYTCNALEFNKVLEALASFCLSDAGRAAALALRPLPDVDAVLACQTLFDETLTWQQEGTFRLASFPDISPLLVFLRGKDPLLEEDGLWAVKEALKQAEQAVRSVLAKSASRPALAALAGAEPLPETSLAALDRCLGDDGALKDESSPGLALVRGEMRSLHQSCLRGVKEYAEKYNIGHYLQGEYMTLASDRYVLPLKANFKGRLQGIIHDYSRTGETLYFEPLFLVEHNNRLQELKQEEREEERKVLRLLTDLLLREASRVEAAWTFLISVDLNLAKCALNAAFDGRLARINTDAPPLLNQARHPLLVLESRERERSKSGRPFKVQPVDIMLRRGDRVLVISGGNAGGKTVALKTLGLIALMTMAGLPCPVGAASSLPAWDNIHAFIGDEQSLDDHVSTFTGQIQHLAHIWDKLSASSLVLLDEFGAGTDPSQGAALAQAVLDGMIAKDAYAVTATHFPALKTYALTRENVRAASVVFDPRTKKPLFHLAYDQVGASQALDVAREHGLPDSVLRRAEHYLLLDGQDSGQIMDRLNALAAEREVELARLNDEQQKTREKRLQLQQRLESEISRLQDDLRQKSRELMQAWKSGKVTARQALRDMMRLRAELRGDGRRDDEAEAGHATLAGCKAGDAVRHVPWDKTAVLKEWDLKSARAKIDLNGVTLWANIGDLEPLPAGAAQGEKKSASLIVNRVSEPTSYMRLDLRGQRADLALAELERFLDRSMLDGGEGVEIVHGRGTGALRKTVHDYLRKHPGITAYAVAPEDQGGDGVTLARFK